MQTLPYRHVLLHRENAIATLTLNRPTAMNSINAALAGELLHALDAIAQDKQVRCLVIRAEGRAFCAGQDLKDPAVFPQTDQAVDLARVVAERYRPLMLRLRTMPVPTIAAVQGVAAGAGASFALMCDIVLAQQEAKFIQAFSAIGLIPDSGATWLLPRLLGRAKAIGLAMLGDKLSADEAEKLGLIWKSVNSESFDAEVQTMAERLSALPTQSLVQTRALLDAGVSETLEQALDAEACAQGERGHAADYREGVAAFVQKRAPHFVDR